jgi:hypothetical protein
MNSSFTRDEVEALLERSDDELLAGLGDAFHGSFPGDSARRGYQFLRSIMTSSQRAICSNDAIRRHVEKGDRAAAASAVADLLLAKYGHVAAVTAAVLILNAGVAQYCETVWAAKADD